MSTLSTPMPARPIDLQVGRGGDELLGHLGGRADGEAVILADHFEQLVLVLAEIGQVVDLDAAILEDLHGGGGEFVGNENAGACALLSICHRECEVASSRIGMDGMRVGTRPPIRKGAEVGERASGCGVNSLRLQPSALAFWRAKAQSSQGVSASRSAVSTVAPHQMRSPSARRDRRRCHRRRLPSRAPRRCPWRRPPGRPRRAPVTSGSTIVRHTEVLERVAGSTARLASQPDSRHPVEHLALASARRSAP
jgi:hypothetical protein